MRRVDITEQFFLDRSIPEPNSGCWIWLHGLDGNGYASLGQLLAHRVSYELFVGPIPATLTIDHTCTVNCCVNPDHLEPVTRAENTRRQMARLRPSAAACLHGHAFSQENTYRDPRGWRACRSCQRTAASRYRAKTPRSART